MTVDNHDDHSVPVIRTKINLLPDVIDKDFLAIVERLRTGQLDVAEYQKASLDYFLPIIMGGGMAELEDKAMRHKENLELMRRHIDDCRYTVILYRVPDRVVHPPHHHFNVISTQIVVRGKLRIREYDRIDRDKDGNLRMRLVSDQTLLPGDHFQASEWKKNVHWFQAIDGDALIFNTNARGFEARTFDHEEGHFGRRYIDPTLFSETGIVNGREIDEEAAENRFQTRSLDDFPVPSESITAPNCN